MLTIEFIASPVERNCTMIEIQFLPILCPILAIQLNDCYGLTVSTVATLPSFKPSINADLTGL